MEMTKKPTTHTRPGMSPSPFSSSAERAELERALLSSTTASSVEQSSTSSQNPNYFVPTAVPIVGDTFNEHGIPVMAVATATIASLPPPPSASAAMASNIRTNDENSHKKSTKKSESFLDDDGVIVRPEPPSYTTNSGNNNFPLPTAPTIPTYTTNLPSTQQLTTSAQLRAANVCGTILSEEEMVGVARAQRQRSAIQYHDDEAVMRGNVRAARKAGRSDEGLTVDEGVHDIYNLNSGAEGEKQEDDKQKHRKPGYEVNEYDTTEYDTGEYDTAEYKSMYD